METSDLAQLARTHEARVDKLDSNVSRLKYESQQFRSMLAEVKSNHAKLAKEVSHTRTTKHIDIPYIVFKKTEITMVFDLYSAVQTHVKTS